ncbi:hypothetical protein ACFQV2_19960 [Actinokineospora soli]|uniref:Oxidoreductase family, NAD-binding Rossmann fold n=1 Tax=Actinokineospora soli TaxID=1048753 RepID=A0ABW2TRP2_9PSEU
MTVSLAIVGAGARGAAYGRIAAAEGARVTAVADPDPAAAPPPRPSSASRTTTSSPTGATWPGCPGSPTPR